VFRILAKSAKRAEILIYGPIGPEFWGDEVSAAKFAEMLAEVGDVAELDVRINSPGGDVFDGVAIYRQLVEHKAKITVHIDGIAASAASFIAMAGDHIIIAEAGVMMIHDAWSFAVGDAAEFRRVADRLDLVSQTIAEIYSARAGKAPTEVRDKMRAETWFTAKEAVDFGLAHEVAANKAPAEAKNAAELVVLDEVRFKFKNAPPQYQPGRSAVAAMVAKQQVAISLSRVAASGKKRA
jgi:ATP-dependent protease ClpP protease subunit